MKFEEAIKRLNINNENYTVNPGVPYLELSNSSKEDSKIFEFEVVKYGTYEGKKERFNIATINMSYFVESLEYPCNTDDYKVSVIEELAKRLENMGYKGILIDSEVIDKLIN